MLVGPPGVGKTQFLKAIEKHYKEDSYFALASGSTGAGMINQCFETQPRFLLLDEIEDLRQSDQATLLSLLQDGVLVETKVSKTLEGLQGQMHSKDKELQDLKKKWRDYIMPVSL